jgi:integrase
MLTGELLDVIRRRAALRQLDCMYMFHRDGTPLGDFRKAWRNACAAAGLVGRHFHDMRRSAVRNTVRAGVPERAAMAVSGHKTRAVFDRYNVGEDDLAAAAERTPRMWRGAVRPHPA